MEPNECYTWLLAVRAVRAQRRLEFQDDVNAGMMPKGNRGFKLALGQIAYDVDDPRYANLVNSMASMSLNE